MKSVISLTLAASLVMASLPVDAQEATPTPVSLNTLNRIGPAVSSSLAQATAPDTTQTSSPNTESRFPNARLVRLRVGGQIDEVAGVLVSDPEGQELRFELADRTIFAAPYDRITAMHWEEAKYPKRALNRSSSYLTVHYSDGTGQGKVESVRLLSEGDSASVFATLERDSGLKIDRSVSPLLGLPIYVAAPTVARSVSSFAELRGLLKAKQTIYVQAAKVTGGYGFGIKGTVLDLSGSTLRLLADGQRREFSERDVLVVSERHKNMGKGALIGLGVGAGLGLLNIAGWCGKSDRDSCGNATGIFPLIAGFGALIGAIAGGQIEHERVLFLAPDLKQSRAFTMTSFINSSGRGLAATLGF